MKEGRLIVICGLPGAGKTTLAKDLESRLGAVRLCPDEWLTALAIDIYDEAMRARVEALQWKFAQVLLRLGQVVLIEWGTWGRSERDTLRLRARALGAKVELRTLLVSTDELFARIQTRGMENPPIRREDLDRSVRLFQTPNEDEIALFDEPM